MRRYALLLLGLVIVQVSFGCGPGGPARQPTINVTAKLLVDDKPFGPALVSLSPTAEARTKLPNATGTVTKDGVVTLSSYQGSVGIVPGTYSVSLTSDPKSSTPIPSVVPATVEIKQSDTAIEIQLKSAKANDPNASMTPILPPTP
ncbi:MAG: hypothetical protein AABP62_11990 [Planctomycetota bacterium]